MQPVDTTTVRELPPIHRISRSGADGARDKKEDRGGGKKERGESVREGRSRGIEEGKKKEEKRGMENGGCCNAMTYVIYLKREGIRDDLCCTRVIWQPALLIIRKMSRFIRSSDRVSFKINRIDIRIHR